MTKKYDDSRKDRSLPENWNLKGMKAIRLYCLDCCSYQEAEVRFCVSVRCPVWHLRFGRSPKKGDVHVDSTAKGFCIGESTREQE